MTDSRRAFLSKMSLLTGGLFVADSMFENVFSQSTFKTSASINATWKVYPDGSFDLVSDSLKLLNAFPAMNGLPIRPITIDVKSEGVNHKIKYNLREGSVLIELKNSNGNLSLASSMEGFKKAPHWFQPLSARAEGLEKFYYQGLGFGGPSGFAHLNSEPYVTPVKTETRKDDTWFLESYLLSGLVSKDNTTLVVAALDHRNYLQKTSLSNRERRWGLINRHLLQEDFMFETEFSTEEISLDNKTLSLPELHFLLDSNPWTALSKMTDKIAVEMKARPPKAPCYHWCSWYIKKEDFGRQDLENFISGVKNNKVKVEFQTIQIDDGYSPYEGDWLENKSTWPKGMEDSFSYIKKKGYAAGVWIGAFRVDNQSNLAKNHPDWLLRRVDNTIWEEGKQKMYILDTSHPEAFAYLRNVFRTMKKWGATFYKTDFMDWGLQDSLRVKRYTPGKTSVQYFTDVLKMIREEIGEDSYWLGCISPFGQFIGYADGMRMTDDTSKIWTKTSMDNLFDQMEACHFLNGKLWQNDPDVMFLSEKNSQFNFEELKSIAYYMGILGGSVNTSEWLNEADAARLWAFLKPGDKIRSAVFPYWSQKKKNVVLVLDYPDQQAWGILIVNSSMEPNDESYQLKDLTGESELNIYEWTHLQSQGIGKKSSLSPNLKSHECKLYYATKKLNGPSEKMSIAGVMV